jgi:ketol-acid reductoisomerase
MRRILREVRSGHFVEKLMEDAKADYPRLKASRAKAKAHPIEAIGERLRHLKDSSS